MCLAPGWWFGVEGQFAADHERDIASEDAIDRSSLQRRIEHHDRALVAARCEVRVAGTVHLFPDSGRRMSVARFGTGGTRHDGPVPLKPLDLELRQRDVRLTVTLTLRGVGTWSARVLIRGRRPGRLLRTQLGIVTSSARTGR